MKSNVGGIDKIFRIVAGLGLIGMAVAGIGTPWTWIGVLPLATGLFNFCPAYAIFGINSSPLHTSLSMVFQFCLQILYNTFRKKNEQKKNSIADEKQSVTSDRIDRNEN